MREVFRRLVVAGVVASGVFVVLAAVGYRTMLADSMTLSGVSATDEGVVLIDGRRAEGCVTDEVFAYDGVTLSVGDLRKPQVASLKCYSELAAFAHKRGALLVADYQWSASNDNRTATLPAIVSMQVDVRVVTNLNSDLAKARADAALAITLLEANRVGIHLDTTITKVTPTSDPGKLIGDGCLQADNLIASNTAYSASSLNVYYVPMIKMPDEFDLLGYTCFESGVTNILYVTLSAPVGTVLLHEIGHALSLRYDNGHVPKSTFGTKNLMRGDMDVDAWEAAATFRLGQVYRMNFDATSWLNLSGDRTGPTHFCQDRRSDEFPCPLLSVNFP